MTPTVELSLSGCHGQPCCGEPVVDTVEIIFGRRIITGRQRAPQGTFKTKVITRGTDVTINAFYRHSRIGQYLNYLQP